MLQGNLKYVWDTFRRMSPKNLPHEPHITVRFDSRSVAERKSSAGPLIACRLSRKLRKRALRNVSELLVRDCSTQFPKKIESHAKKRVHFDARRKQRGAAPRGRKKRFQGEITWRARQNGSLLFNQWCLI